MKIKRPKSKQPIPKHAKRVFSGVTFDIYQWKQKMFNGSSEIFEKIKRSDIVNVLPILDGNIVLTEQKQPNTAPFIGAAGGRIDENETPIQAVKRELLEETGIMAKKFILWDAMQPFAKIDCAIYTFIAKDCKKVSDLKLDAGEKIKLIKVYFDEFLNIISQENFRDLEIVLKVLRIKNDPKKLEKMKRLFLD